MWPTKEPAVDVWHDSDHQHAHDEHGRELMPVDDGFAKEEINLFNSTLELRDIKVEEILVDWSKLFKLKFDQVITEEIMKKVIDRSFSIIPIYRGDGTDVVGVIKAKSLIDYKKFLGRTIGDSYKLTPASFIAKDNTLLELLKIFQVSKSTVVFVTSDEIRPTEKFDGSTRRSFMAVNPHFLCSEDP